MQVLADTSFWYALLNRADKNHQAAYAYYVMTPDEILLPAVALTELAFLLFRSGGSQRVVSGLQAVKKARGTIVDLLPVDYDRMLEILAQYADSRIDFVDACIMAIAERLQISRILTFDHRDFGLYRPVHIAHFELLP